MTLSRAWSTAAWAAAAALAAAPAWATPTMYPQQVQQCDGTFLSEQGPNLTTNNPSPIIKQPIQDTGGLRVGRQRAPVTASTWALYRFDGNYQVNTSACDLPAAHGCGQYLDTTWKWRSCMTETWYYVDANGSPTSTIGSCRYSADATSCTSPMNLYSASSPYWHPPGGCSATTARTPSTITYPAIPDAGVFSQAMTLNSGQSNRGYMTPASTWNLGTNATLSAWVRATANGSNQRILSRQDSWKYWGFGINSAGQLRRFDSREASGSQDNAYGSGLLDGSWHYVAVVRKNAVDWRYFIDGSLVGSRVASSTAAFGSTQLPWDSNTNTFIGSYNGTGEFFNGNIDDLRVSGAALTDAEIYLDYHSTRHKFSTDSGATYSDIIDDSGTNNASYSPVASNGTAAMVYYQPPVQANIGPQHRYQFFAQGSDGGPAGTLALSVTVDNTPPNAPSLDSPAQTTSLIRWRWTQPTHLCYKPGDAGLPLTYTLINTADSSSVQFSNPGTGSITYDESAGLGVNVVRSRVVRATDHWGTGQLSNGATVYTLANPASNFSFGSVSTGSVVLIWSTNGNPTYTRWEVMQSPDNFVNPVLISTPVALSADFSAARFGGASTLTFPITGLDMGATTYFQVRAFNGRASDNFGAAYTAARSTTVVSQPGPPAPAISGYADGISSVTWTWGAPVGAASYTLRPVGGPCATQSGLVQLYGTCQGLSPNAPYSAQVNAVNSQGAPSMYSPAYTIFTMARPPIAGAFSLVSTNSLTVSWDQNLNPSYTSYEVSVATDSLFGSVLTTRTTTGASLSVGGLFPGATYYARVRAFSGGQDPTVFSGYGSVCTLPDSSVSLSSSPPSPYAPPSGTLGLWHLDDSTGTSAADATFRGNSGVLTCLDAACSSTPTFTAGPPDMGTAAAFSGTRNSLVRVPSISAYDLAGSFTVSAWAKPASLTQPNGAALVAQGIAGSENFSLDVYGGRYRFLVKGSVAAVSATAATTIRLSEWDQVTGVYDATGHTASLFINGARSGAAVAAPARTFTAGQSLSFGSRQSAPGTYDLALSGAVDEVRLVGSALSAAQVLTDYQSSSPGTVALPSPNSGVRLVLPPNAFGAAAAFYASNDPVSHPLRISVADLQSALTRLPTGMLLSPSTLIEIVPTVNGVPFTQNLGSSATVSLPYADENGDGIVDGTNPQIPVSTLAVYTLDTMLGRWVALPTTLDTVNRRVSATTPHFSVFAQFGTAAFGTSLAQVRAYPNPWKAGSGGRFDAAGVTFDNLPAGGTIRIFTLSGQKVVELSFTGADGGRLVWNGANANGRPVASGVYFARVQVTGDQTSTVLKFAIER